MKEHGVPYTDRDGVYAVSSMQELAELAAGSQPRAYLYELAAAGVSRSGTTTTPMSTRRSSVGAGDGAAARDRCCAGTTSIGKNCTIGPNSYLENVKRRRRIRRVNASQVYDSDDRLRTRTVGPFAYVRPGSRIGIARALRRFCGGQELHHRRRHEDLAPDLRRRQRRRQEHQLRLRHGHGQLRPRRKSTAPSLTTTPSSAATPISSRPCTWARARISPPAPPSPTTCRAQALAIARARQQNKKRLGQQAQAQGKISRIPAAAAAE